MTAAVPQVPEFTIHIGGETLSVPSELPLLPIRNTVVFPGTTRPLNVGRARSLSAVRAAAKGDGLLAVLTQRNPGVENPQRSDLHEVGTITKVVQLLDLYLNDSAPIPIRILDDMLKLLIGGGATKEGIGLSDFGILIFDTDGSITKNDTLKSAYDGADRFATNWKVGGRQILDLLNSEEYRQYHNLQKPTSPACLGCPELQICGGGMTVHRWNDRNGYDNPIVYCADQLLLISNMRNRLKQRGMAA